MKKEKGKCLLCLCFGLVDMVIGVILMISLFGTVTVSVATLSRKTNEETISSRAE